MAKKAPASFNLLDHLSKEDKVKPFTAVIDADGTEITFPNPLEMKWTEAQRFMNIMTAEEVTVSEVFSEWLSAEDYAALEASDLPMEAVMVLARAASEHYGSAFGDPKA